MDSVSGVGVGAGSAAAAVVDPVNPASIDRLLQDHNHLSSMDPGVVGVDPGSMYASGQNLGAAPPEQHAPFDTTLGGQPAEMEVEASHMMYGAFLQTVKNHFGTSSMSDKQVQAAADVEFDAAVSAFYFNLCIFVLLMGSYEVFSRLVPSVYAGRRHHVGSDRMIVELPKSYLPLGWVPTVMRASWEQVRKAGGLDAYMFLRYIRLCLIFTVVSGFWGMCLLWPVFATGGNNAEGWYRLGMANITQESWRLWFPTVFMWLTTFYVFFLMNEEYKHYLELRTEYLAKGDSHTHPQHQYSLMVERIPHELRSDRALYDYFEALFPGRVFSACVVLNLPELEKLSAKRQQAVRRLEKSVAFYEATGKRGTHVVGRTRVKVFGIESLPIIPSPVRRGRNMDELDDDLIRVTATESLPKKGERVDSINYYTRLLVDMNTTVEKIQEEKKELAAKGNDQIKASQWLGHQIGLAQDAAISALSRNSTPSKSQRRLVLDFNRGEHIQRCSQLFNLMGLDFLTGGMSYFSRKLDVVVDSVVGASHSSTGFVTFKDMATLTCAVRAPLTNDPDVLEVAVAPEPRDIKWENAHINLDWSSGRETSANFLLFLGAILWSIPVAAIQAIANIDSLADVPGLGWISYVGDDKFAAFLNAYLPVVALLCIILLLPILFQWVAVSYELRKTESDVQGAILGRYFYYQLANVYVTVSAGSLWDSLGEILDHPTAAFEILGNSLPKCVGYFVTFLMTKAFAGLPLVMLRFHALSRMAFLKLCFNQKLLTQRELDEVYKKETVEYGWEYPTQLLVIVICFTYACISPVILPVGAIYFLGALVIYKKQVLVVFTPEYESGGELFPATCHRTLVGLICGQFTLIGYSILREGFWQPLVLFPLPIVTVFMIRVFQRLYADPAKYLSLEKAIQLDKHATDELEFSEDTYRQPVLAEKAVEPQAYRKTIEIDDDSSSVSTSVRSNVGIMHDASSDKMV